MSENEMQIKELRTQFLNKLETLDSDIFHPSDINKVKTDDHYLKRFLLHNDQTFESAFNMLWETCEWRKKFGVNDISEKNVNKDILELGSVFPYGKDKDGKTMLVFKSKKHYKGAFDSEDHKRCLIYWMERLERQENGEKISLFFDMDGAVLANMDLEYTKYLISLFKNYYPNFLNYIIIFEMAWVLNTVFKVIKTLLPPKAVEKMKFINKSNIKLYVDLEYALKSWGGKDFYVYHFEPEEKSVLSSTSSNEDHRKKVHFADMALKSDQLNESGFEETLLPPSATNITNGHLTTTDVMIFNNEGSELTSSILLKNENSQSVSYKIKTTSPEKFRVRPSSGILAPGASSSISVVFLPGYQVQNLQRDKFLILSIPINHTEMTQQEINDLWKQVDDKEVRQHKIQCSLPQNTDNNILKNGSTINSGNAEDQKVVTKLRSDITKLNTYAGSLREELMLIRRQQWMILFTLIVLICSLIFSSYLNYSKPSNIKENCWVDPQGRQV